MKQQYFNKKSNLGEMEEQQFKPGNSTCQGLEVGGMRTSPPGGAGGGRAGAACGGGGAGAQGRGTPDELRAQGFQEGAFLQEGMRSG